MLVRMKVLLIGHDFDFSAGDGISRYSFELHKRLRKCADVNVIATGKIPRPLRAFLKIKAKDVDIVHLMYPDAAKVDKGSAKMFITWHDLRLFSKYSAASQYRYKPTLTERFNIAASFIKNWGFANYVASNAALTNSSQTMKEVKEYFSSQKLYDSKKTYKIIPLGVDRVFMKAKVWKGERRDFAYVGSIHLKHKNLHGLLQIFDKVAGKHNSKLHIFTSSPHAEELLKTQLKRFKHLSKTNVLLHLRFSDAEIARCLPRLVAYLQLTRHEGLGMPILEALATGTDAVILKDASIPEEAKKHAIKVSEANASALLLKLAANPKPAQNKAIKYARSFTWERTVRETIAAYRKALAK